MSERYELKGQIGQGGIGTVHKAFDTQLKRDVAIKRLIPSEEGITEEAAENLIKEATTLSALQHPNIVTVYDVGTDEKGGFVVMELLKGETFDVTIDRGALTFEDFKNVVTQTLEALIAAHHVELIHRDLKPSNLMVNWMPSGKFQIKILDFGLAKFSKQPSVQTIDQGDAILGSIYFMAPEQFERIPLDARTDLYSMGCMYYQCLTGKYPFDGDTAPQVMASHLQNRVTPLSKLRPDVPEWACDWVMWLINRKMEDRPETAKVAYAQFQKDKGSPAHEAATAAAAAPLAAAGAPQMAVGVTTTPLAPGQPVQPAPGQVMPVQAQAPPGQMPGQAPGMPAPGYQPPAPASLAVKPSFPLWAKISIPVLLVIVGIVAWVKFGGENKNKAAQDLVVKYHDQYESGKRKLEGGPEDVKTLIGYMIDRNDTGTTQSVMRTLEHLEGSGVDKAIVDNLKRIKNPTQLQAALLIIGERDYKEGLSAVFPYVSHESAEVRNGAFGMVAELGGKSELESLLELAAEQAEDDGKHPYTAIIQAVASKTDDPDTRVQPIIAESKKHDGKVRGAMLQLLGDHGGDTGWKAIKLALDGGDKEAKLGALRGLTKWPDGRPSEMLYSLAKSSPDKSIQLIALVAYIENLQQPSNTSAEDRVEQIKELYPTIQSVNTKRDMLFALGAIVDPTAKELAEKIAEDEKGNIAKTANNAAKRIEEALEKIVVVEDDTYLAVDKENIKGENIRYNNDPKMRSAVDWNRESDRVSWNVRFKEKGTYAIYITQSCEEDDKDTYEVSIGDDKVTGEVIHTEDAKKFKTKKIGQVDVPDSGTYQVVVKSRVLSGKILMNLKQVRIQKVD